MLIQPFHLALPVTSIEKTKLFYLELLKCPVMLQDNKFIAIDFFGHYLAFREHVFKLQVVDTAPFELGNIKANVPSRHFGLTLSKSKWLELKVIFKIEKINFFVSPVVDRETLPDEIGFMMVEDYNGYGIEFKYAIFNDGDIVKPKITNRIYSHLLEEAKV